MEGGPRQSGPVGPSQKRQVLEGEGEEVMWVWVDGGRWWMRARNGDVEGAGRDVSVVLWPASLSSLVLYLLEVLLWLPN